MKKLFSITLCLVFIIIVLFGNGNNVAAAEKKTYSVKKGKKITLETNLKNAVWGSDDVAIAKVTSKGVVKGISAGTCTIVATADGKSELFSVKVTKTKKKINPVQITTGGDLYSFVVLNDYPDVVFDGIEITLCKSSFSEIYSALSKYTSQNMPELNDILTGSDTIKVYKNDKFYAAISLANSASKLAKDAIITNIEFGYPSSSDCYYFNKNFKVKSMPTFDTITESNLFSSQIHWVFQDWNDNNYMFKLLCKDTLKALPEKYAFCYTDLYPEKLLSSPYTLFCVFDISTHECIFVTMLNKGALANF